MATQRARCLQGSLCLLRRHSRSVTPRLPARCPARSRLWRRKLEQAGDPLGRAPPLRPALWRASREVPGLLRSGRTSRRVSTRHPGYAGTGVVRSCANLKRLLPETADAEYIAGFVDGWLAADGDPVKAGSWRLRSTDHEALDWLEQAAPLAGYVAVGSGQGGERRDELRRPQPTDPLALPGDAGDALASHECESRRSRRSGHVLRSRPSQARVHTCRRNRYFQLRSMRTGVPGRGDFPRGRPPGQVERLRRDQLRVPGPGEDQLARRRVRDRAQRPERADRPRRKIGIG